MKSADPDQQSVYYAESTVFENTLFEETVADSDIETLAAELFDSDWWQSRKIPTPTLSLRRLEALYSQARTYGPTSKRSPEIGFCIYQVNPWTLAHEASHVAADHLHSGWFYGQSIQPHGPQFRSVYVEVAERLLGGQAASDLQRAFSRFITSTTPASTLPSGTTGEDDLEGIFPRWRMLRQIEELRRAAETHERNSIRINGAIAL